MNKRCCITFVTTWSWCFCYDSAAVNHLLQTEPPSVGIVDLFPDGGPEGEIQDYPPLQDGYGICI